MTLHIVSTRKVVVLGWTKDSSTNEWNIKGANASISVVHADGTSEEKREVVNSGEGDIFFPANYEGLVTVTIEGSHGGTETQTLHIT